MEFVAINATSLSLVLSFHIYLFSSSYTNLLYNLVGFVFHFFPIKSPLNWMFF